MFARSKRFDSLIQNRVKRIRAIGTSQNTRKLFSQFRIFQSSTKRILNNLLCFRLLDFNLTLTESIFRIGKSLLVISIGRKIRLLGAFGLSLSLNIPNLSILQTLHTITKSFNGKTIGIGLSGLSKIILFTRPKFSYTSITLGRILNGFNLGKLGVNLINFSLKTLRKGVGLSGRTNELEETIGILDTLSLCDSLQTLSISILGLCLNILSLNTLQSGFAERRSTCHNVRHRVILIRTLGRNRTTVGLRNITLRSTHRLEGRALEKRVNPGGLHSGTLCNGRLEFVISPRSIIFHAFILGLSVLTALGDLKIIHLLLPLTILSVQTASRDGRTGGSGAP